MGPQQPPDPYADMTDAEVLDRAREALAKAAAMEPKSIRRAITFAVFDSAMQELDRRAARYVLWKLHEADGGD